MGETENKGPPIPENVKLYVKELKEKPYGPVMDPTLNNIFKIITLISPIFVVLLLVTISIINSDIKGFVYLGCVILLFFFFFIFQSTMPFNQPTTICAIWNIGPFRYPSFISALYTYTIVYLFYPMVTNEVYNFPLLIILLIIYISDVIIRCFKMACTNLIGVMVGSAAGVIFAVLFILLLSNNKELLYYNDLISSKVACSVPSKQKFKCSVYNNGQLIGSSIQDK
jgi:hypothetical protein